MIRLLAPALAGITGLALAAAATATPQTAASDNPVKAGVDAWSRGDDVAAVKAWRGAAERGDADAQFNLGQAYKLGRGVAANPAEAEKWYRKAAEQGHYQAEENYGLALFQNGKRTEAAPWLEKAAMRGAPRAQLVYGTMLFNGDGGQAKDWVRAYALMTRASGSGLPQASETLAKMDEFIPQDQRQKGLELARAYQVQAQRSALPPEVLASASGAKPPIRTVALPPSTATAATPTHQPGAPYAIPGSTPSTPVAAPSTPAPVAATPRPAPPRPATAAPQPTGKWRIQLGAFGNEANARRLWGSIQPRVSTLGNRQAYYVKAGSVVRLQAGPFASSREAASACAAVKARGSDCLPVAP
ncbi:SPOR domain-containing protein [Hephaestia sp. GCM10023244]|uniref:SPOR domain-containing protein n=1 Tax=unclassified Hephaestia TaxID=2631281 RepID=UPI00207756A8|nr:SPOR domain-containing protein [Hephaestia sp. MAHUQ-44]MCM8730027.1 SPOR domain-containing protein [Hephaestia sp. MAHUQ-44]